MPTPSPESAPHSALFDWARSQKGYLSDKVELSQSAETGFCIRVKADTSIAQGTLIARCPTTATLSILNALDAPGFERHGTSFPSAFLQLSHFTVQCFFLIDQYEYGSDSYWFPFFQTLPSPSQTGKYTPFETSDLEWLEGTNLAPALRKRLDIWRTEFDSGLDLLRAKKWQRAIDGIYSWDLFRWAAMVFSSRGFSSAVLVQTYAADVARPFGDENPEHRALNGVFDEPFAVLVPVLDMLNYRPIVQVEWQANVNYIGLLVLEDLNPGQEVCNNYGPKDNEHLILGYGFAIESNPFDFFNVGFSVPPGSPLEAARELRRKKYQEDSKQYSYQIFNPSHPTSKTATYLHDAIFSYDLLDAVSILSANTSELQSSTFLERHSFMSPNSNERFGRLLFNTIAQVLAECQAKVVRLQSKDPSRKGRLPMNQMQRYAEIYRKSQLNLVEVGVEACTYYLDIARGLRPSRLPEQSTVSPTLYDFLTRAPPSMISVELFDFDSLLTRFWSTLVPAIRDVVEILCNAVVNESIVIPGLRDAIRTKLQYMTVLYIARSCRGSEINSPRVRHWIDSLTKWYSTDSTELCSPAEDFVKLLELLMEADTDQAREAYTEIGTWGFKQSDAEWDEVWWDPAKLCWAWNVVEEEGVQIPGGPYLVYVPDLDEPVQSN